MKNKGYTIFKIVALTLAIIIPLTVAFLMCRYTYNRHFDNYESIYFANIKYDRKGNDKKNYKEQIEGLLGYTSYQYRLFATKEVKYNNDQTVGVLDIYQVIDRVENEDVDGNIIYSYDLNYYFILRDVYYGSIYRLEEGSDDATIPSTNAIPSVYMQIRNANDFDNDDDCLNYEFNGDTVFDYSFVDYGATPSKIGTQYILAVKINASALKSDKLTIAIHCDEDKVSNYTETPAEEKVRYAYTEADSLEVDNFYVDLTDADLANFTVGYNSDAKAAGYTNYVFKTYWWWEALLTIVLVGALTGIFFMVLTYRNPDEE